MKPRFLGRLSREIGRRGALEVLRNGVKDSGCKFRLAYFRPASGLNEESQRLHAANLFAVVRQLHFSQPGDQSLDLALFLNGIPVFTAELKNPLNGQDVEDAIRQYQNDRDPREPLFADGRCLAHFAVDPETGVRDHPARRTRDPVSCHSIRGASAVRGIRLSHPPVRASRPTTSGSGSGPGTASSTWSASSSTRSRWKMIAGTRTGERFLIFPRYQQLDCVRRLVRDARNHGPGQRYLIQHSAGSGKSFTIAWLAHQLSVLHDRGDRRVFDSVVVVTDRRVLDRQLQRTIRQF